MQNIKFKIWGKEEETDVKKVRVSVYTKTGNTASIDSRNTRISKKTMGLMLKQS